MVFQIYRTQQLPVSIDQAWEFFSSPRNLARITPADMGFKILDEEDAVEMYPGQIIRYTVRPLWGIPVQWTTEITHVNAPFYFVDNQLSGPYRIWHHQHHFKEIPGGVETSDRVHYALPGGFVGKWAHWPLVKKRLEHIFDHRFEEVEKMFGRVNNK